MKEEFLHYLWQYRLLNPTGLKDIEGKAIKIIQPGLHNTNSGPDFLNAKIEIDGIIWAGHVELHMRSADWKQHGHQNDKSYDNVVLHAVYEADKAIEQSINANACLQLKDAYDAKLLNNYNNLSLTNKPIPCSPFIDKVDAFIIKSGFHRLLVSRIERKTAFVEEVLKQTTNNWEEAFYRMVAKSFGLKINSYAFERLARSLPNKLLAKHKSSLLQTEALLFGQAGYLNNKPLDDYQAGLQKEYLFLKSKYQLNPIPQHIWRFMRLRPASFPTIRLAQFAQLIHQSSHLFAQVIEAKSLKNLEQLFSLGTSIYWQKHYQFGITSRKRQKHFGKAAIHSLIINTIVPVLFSYAQQKGDDTYKDIAIDLLEQLPTEKNNVLNKWSGLGINSQTAYDSQALLELNNEFCTKLKCLQCYIGNKVLQA